MSEVSTLVAKQQNLPTAGIALLTSTGDGPAAQAGLPERSILTTINGKIMTSTQDVIAYLELNTAPGDMVTLHVFEENGTERDVKVTIGARPRVSDQQTVPSTP